MKPSISFFCPAYFDEKNLPRLMPEVVAVLREIADRYEIIIIDDASPDRTGEVAEELKKLDPNIIVIHHESNWGYGATLSHGFRTAIKYEWVFTTDGDRQYDVREIKTFLPYLEDYDAVIGFRTIRSLSRFS